MLDGKVVLVTGATGSFGQKFCRNVLENWDVRKLIVFSRDELKQYQMGNDVFFSNHRDRLRFYLGDVRDRDRLMMAFRGVDVVIHAAALKQIGAAEYNPFEAIKTNVLGGQNIIEAALERDVKKVVALSTDKAVNPINLYGSTKLCADKLFVAGNFYAGATHPTRFALVRYGNVIGSRGSVVPHFLECRKRGVVQITHPDMTRFWIALDRAVWLVMKALEEMHGGEIFVPKLPSMKVTDLARLIAPHCRQEVTGIRPGEKLHESMISNEEARTTLEFKDHYRIMPDFLYRTNVLYPEGRVEGGRSVPEDFCYQSDTNPWWIEPEEMIRLIEDQMGVKL